ncbi:MAG: hypothetical protein JO089_06615 [Alphaproteobacteria bacterium]|nr:hypothetical protein [Alphaproteobacteria bacterium]
MRRQASVLAGICLTALTSFPACAGAWTQSENQGLVITTAAYYGAGDYFDNGGSRRSQPRYTKEELNPYVEYGLRDGLTLGGNFFIDRLDDTMHTRTGIGDSEIFLRRRLWQEGDYVLSVQPLARLPALASSQRQPALGSATPDAAVSLLGGMQFTAFGQTHYAEMDAGYRFRFGPRADQVLLAATLGLRLDPRLTVMPQLFQTFRMGAGNGSFTESPRDDYTLTTAQLSAVYQLTDADAVQAGAFSHVAGKNTGAGGGVLLAYWRTF